MIVQPSADEMQACLSLYDHLQVYLEEAEAYDRIATVEYVREDVFDQVEEEEEEEII